MTIPNPQQPMIPQLQPVSEDQRRLALSMAVAAEVARGARVESQTDFSATLVTGSKPNHVLHLILTIFTCAVWALVWIIVALAQKEHRTQLMVDSYGQVLRQVLT